MIGSVLLWSGLLLGQADTGANPAADVADVAAQVRRLVLQLDDDSSAKRQAAEEELLKLGPRVLDVLPPVRTNTSAEVKVRLQRIRTALEKASAEAASLPSLVTLEGTMPLTAALAAIEKQTGNKFADFRPRFNQQKTDPMVTVAWSKVTFWQALDDLLDQAELTVYNFGGEPGTLALIARDAAERKRSGRATYSGLFRFEGVRIQSMRDLRTPENDSLRYTLEVAWEPRLAPIVLQLSLAEIKAADGDGNPLTVADRRSQLEIPVESSIPATELIVPLELPRRTVQEIATLNGQIAALLPGRVESFEFSGLEAAKTAEQQKAGAIVTLEPIRKNGEVYEVRVRLKFDKAANALESHRGWVLNNVAYMLDAKGQRLDHLGLEQTRQDVNEVGVAYLFDCEDGLKGCKFVYKTPSMIIRLPVSYELKKIELP